VNVGIEGQSPKQCNARRDFDNGVETESNESNAPGKKAGSDGYNAFKAVPADSEEFQIAAVRTCRTRAASLPINMTPLCFSDWFS